GGCPAGRPDPEGRRGPTRPSPPGPEKTPPRHGSGANDTARHRAGKAGTVRKKRHSDPVMDTRHWESREMNADQHFMALLETSSLGTPAPRQIRSSTPADVVEDVRRRQAERHPPQPAACQQPATTQPDTTPGSRQGKAGAEASKGLGRPAIAGTRWPRWGIVPVAAALVIVVAAATAAAIFTTRANSHEPIAEPSKSP